MNRGDPQQELSDLAKDLRLADQAYEQGKFAEAAQTYRRALETLELSLGDLDPDVVMCVQRLADAYYALARYDDALPLYKRLLSVGESVLGKEHPDVLAMQSKIGSTSGMVASAQNLPDMKQGAARLTHSSLATLKPEYIKPTDWALDWELNRPASAPELPLEGSSSSWQGGAETSWHAAEPIASDWQTDLPTTSWYENLANLNIKGKPLSDQRVRFVQDSDSMPISAAPPPDELPYSGGPINAPKAAAEEAAMPLDSSSTASAEARAARMIRRKQGRSETGDISPATGSGGLSGWLMAHEATLRAVKVNTVMVTPFVIALALLIGGGFFFFSNLGSQKVAPLIPAGNSVAPGSGEILQYATADNAKLIELGTPDNPSAVSLKIAGHVRPLELQLVRMGPGFSEIAANELSCLSKKDLWYEEVPEGLRDEEGVIYYARTSPESSVLAQMRKLAADANRWYLGDNLSYPSKSNFAFAYAYINPFTGESFLPLLSFQHVEDGGGRTAQDSAEKGEPEIYKLLTKPDGATWQMEPLLSPGAIHCLSVKRDNPPDAEFYLHCCDRHGRLICSADAARVYVLGFRNGRSLSSSRGFPLPLSKSRLVRFCLVKPPFCLSLRMTRAALPLFLIALGAVILSISQLAKPASERLNFYGTGELCALILFVLGIFWGYFLFMAI